MRECRKCKEIIPYRTKIDGVEKNLQRRKFCLKCSPWNTHNTKSDDPSKPAKRSGCYASWKDDEKKKNMLSVLKRGTERKQKLVEMAGGRCKRCGYNKCTRALSFHHINPEDKCFVLTKNNLWSKTWETVLAEYNKCEMLCLNCHAELEDELECNKNINYHKWLDR